MQELSRKTLLSNNMERQRQPHVLVMPFPAQGHIAPLMKLSLKIASHGVKVTFVNTELTHERVMGSLPEEKSEEIRSLVSLVSIPDGVDGDARTDGVKMVEAMRRAIPGYFEDLILRINESNLNEKISCVIAEASVGWVFEVTKKLGIEAVVIWIAGAPCLALAFHVPQLLEDEVINIDGVLIKDEQISLSEDVPAWTNSEVGWRSSDPVLQKAILIGFFSIVPEFTKFYDKILCNSVYELDSAALRLIPKALPIGPLLLAGNHLGPFAGNTWPEDKTCLEWLDKQASGSVIYVAFGSSTRTCGQQIEELAHGLEIAGRSFLWVVRPDFMDGTKAKFPDGFKNRVAERAKFVEWAPQEKVLAHPSVACFLSHCGWNSAMEGLINGVPFLCWPYVADHFTNKNYICNVWKIGLELAKDEDGITSRNEICAKINTFLSSDVIKANVLQMKEVARKSSIEGGSSFNNFKSFIEHIKSL